MKDRKHLTGMEVDKLIEATGSSRNAECDRCLLLLMFRHGLRVSEACALKRSQVDIASRVLHVQRLKKGLFTTHLLRTDELRAIKAYMATRRGVYHDGFFFSSERGKALSRACGFALADHGADTRLIQDFWDIGIFSTRYATPPPIRLGLKGCGGKANYEENIANQI